ncbi:hypothetical protein Ancab_013349 [Ancistrocladus abbreviatus]
MELSIPYCPHLPKTRTSNSSTIFITNRLALTQSRLFFAHNRKLKLMSANASVPPHGSSSVNNGSPTTSEYFNTVGRTGEVERVTEETIVHVKINVDGTGVADNNTSIPFLDHMLQIASHGLFDVHVKATGDIHIDDHHTNEDVALALGMALLRALSDRKGINRFGDFCAPLDEALIHVSLDLSGRPHLSFDLNIPTDKVGTYDTQLVEHFFQSLVNTSGMTLHIRQLAGRNSHHIIEATFKAFARALRQATEHDPRRAGTVPRLSFNTTYHHRSVRNSKSSVIPQLKRSSVTFLMAQLIKQAQWRGIITPENLICCVVMTKILASFGNVEVYCGLRKVSVMDELAQETTRPIVNFDQEATSDLVKCLEVLCSREIERKRTCHAMASVFSSDCAKSSRNNCRVRGAEPMLA